MSSYVYAIQSVSGRIYVGQSVNLNNRLRLHNQGAVPSTRNDRPWVLYKTQRFDTREQARYFEWQLKRSRGKRQEWLESK
jgi:predicted GIY-YIG superfamily endonuclease